MSEHRTGTYWSSLDERRPWLDAASHWYAVCSCGREWGPYTQAKVAEQVADVHRSEAGRSADGR